jgi:hypothetical protein
VSQQRGEYTAQRLISLKRHHPRVRQPSAAMSCKQCGACMARLGRPQRVRAHATAAQSPGVRLHIAPGMRSRGSSWRAPRATGPQCLRCAACRGWCRPAAARATRQGPGATLDSEDKAWSLVAPRRTGSSDVAVLKGRGPEESPAVFYLIRPGEGPAKNPRQFFI